MGARGVSGVDREDVLAHLTEPAEHVDDRRKTDSRLLGVEVGGNGEAGDRARVLGEHAAKEVGALLILGPEVVVKDAVVLGGSMAQDSR